MRAARYAGRFKARPLNEQSYLSSKFGLEMRIMVLSQKTFYSPLDIEVLWESPPCARVLMMGNAVARSGLSKAFHGHIASPCVRAVHGAVAQADKDHFLAHCQYENVEYSLEYP